MLHAHHFSKKLAGSTQSKQLRIDLLYRYKRAKTGKITMLNIRYIQYFIYLNCLLLWVEPARVRVKTLYTRNTWKVVYLHDTFSPNNCHSDGSYVSACLYESNFCSWYAGKRYKTPSALLSMTHIHQDYKRMYL